MAAPEKYAHIDFTPPAGARREAELGLKLRREHGRGGTAVGIARARDIANGVNLSPSTVRRMKAFFDRHASDSKADGFRRGEKGWPSNGAIANKLWGGPSGYAWAKKIVAQMEKADEEDSRSVATYSLDAKPSTIDTADSRRAPLADNVERRYLGAFGVADEANPDLLRVEHRADPSTGKQQTYLVGYAARFGKNSLLLGDFVERIAPTAFEIVEKREDGEGKPLETRCLFNHSPDHLLGRFPTTMKLAVDERGLRYECLLPESRRDLAELVARGDLKGSSFSFVVAEGGERWTTEEGRSIRTVTKIKSLLDCGPVTYPAYDSATVAVAKRSYDRFVASKEPSAVVEKRESGIAARVAKEVQKTHAFIAERRGFCPTGQGGGIDNSCPSGKGGGEGEKGGGSAKTPPKDSGKSPMLGKMLDKIAKDAKTTGGMPTGGKSSVLGKMLDRIAKGEKGSGGKEATPNDSAPIGGKSPMLGKMLDKVDKLAKGAKTTGGMPTGGKSSVLGKMLDRIAKGEKGSGGKEATPNDSAPTGGKSPMLGKMLDKVDKLAKGAKTTGGMPTGGKSSALGKMFDRIAKGEKGSGGSRPSSGEKSLTGKPYKLPEEGGTPAKERVRRPVSKLAEKLFREKQASDPYGLKKKKRSLGSEMDEIERFLQERRGFCPTGEGGGIDNSCGSKGESMEWEKGDHKDPDKVKAAQDFLDRAREGQLARGGKDGGKADDGGGVQTWSKGENFPWTVKQVGDSVGYVQGIHPDGSKTEKYEFKDGDVSEAMKKIADEISSKKKGKRSVTLSEMTSFLTERSA